MKTAIASTSLALLLVLSCFSYVWSMPPHPDLLRRIQSGEIQKPYALEHEAEIRARGVEAPGPRRTIDELRRRSLDENMNILAILVDFSDHPNQVDPEFFDSLLYTDHTGTVRNFYNVVTYGNLTVVTLNMPSALGWEQAPQTYDYYVDGQNGFGTYPHNAQRLTEDAVHLVDDVVDFSNYDNDGDGRVDGVLIIHSGPGAELTGNSNDIWSHKWQTHSAVHVDGVTVSTYSMEPEYWQHSGDMTCGVYAHEMGHAFFGFPDLYDTDYSSNGIGSWSLMAGGSWNGNLGDSPAAPDAWCKTIMGAVTPTNVSSNIGLVQIPNVETSPVIYRLWTDGALGSQYFLIENRQRIGYDAHLPGGGLLIYHIDETRDGNTNEWYPGYEDNGHYKVAVEQADGNWDMERGTNSGTNADPYPGSRNNRFFSGVSAPSSDDYTGFGTFVTVRNISASADTMTAELAVSEGAGNSVSINVPDTSVAVGGSICVPLTVNNLLAYNIRSFQFTLTWDSSLVQPMAPYFVASNIIPPTWTVTQTHTSGSVTITASGASVLSGAGTLICLELAPTPSADDGSVSTLQFNDFTFNQGDPPADYVNGSLTIHASRLVLSPTVLSFSTVQVGQSASRNLVLRNTGGADLVIDSLRVPSPFHASFSTPAVIQASQWLPVAVIFTPDTARLYRDTLTVFSNSGTGILRVPMTGTGTAVDGIQNNFVSLPSQFALTQNFPNPFNPTTVLSYDVPRSVPVSIKVFDVLGRMIDEPVNGVVEAGHHSFSWSCSSCGSGIYFFVMTAEGQHFTQKATLLK